ncbi:hypothetical protein ACFL5V_12265, partial [Fibrobacterota bacterium]
LINLRTPEAVAEEVQIIISRIFPEFDFIPFNDVFGDTQKLFGGHYQGFRACNAMYHDLKHTTDALLATARLIHGAVLDGETISSSNARLALICALFHDTGYIQEAGDATGTGAKYTLTHVDRSNNFMREYFQEKGMSREDFENGRDIINCTGLNTDISGIKFKSSETELLGKMLGTADLLGQMADREYLEKLLFLYYEFKEGGVGDYSSELDLLQKTLGFYELIKKRLDDELSGVYKYLARHFKERWDMDADLYTWYLDKNIDYLKYILGDHESKHRDHLKRGGIVQRLEGEGF